MITLIPVTLIKNGGNTMKTILLILSILFAFYGCNMKKEKQQSTKETKTEMYELVNPSELSFSYRQYQTVGSYKDEYYHGGEVGSVVGIPMGLVGELSCEGKILELANKEFTDDGFILTKEYGKIKFRTSTSLISKPSFNIWLTPSQKKAFKEIKKKIQENEISKRLDLFNYNPIDKETGRLQVPKQYSTIQKAINKAVDGSTIIIAPGIYKENIVISEKSVFLTSEKPEDVDVVKSTVLDATHKGPTIVLENSSSIIAGLTIRNGHSKDKIGGGLRVTGNSSPLIKGNIIEDNSSANIGGGIGLITTGEPRIINNTIKNNKGKMGGGGIYSISSTIYMMNNTILNNTVSKGGGGIWLQECNGLLLNNLIEGNSADAGGGVYVSKKSEVDIIQNEIKNNKAEMGAGIFVIGNCKVKIHENRFEENKAKKAAGGIGIAVQSVCTLIGNNFIKNEAPQAGVGLVQESTVDERDNTFTENKPENKLLK